MNKKLITTLLAGAAVISLGAASAQASVLNSVVGDVNFIFDGFNAANTNYVPNGLPGSIIPGLICTNVIACNGASGGSSAPGSAGASPPQDLYSFAFVSSIKQSGSSGSLWSAGNAADGDDFLLVYFHGFQDQAVGQGTQKRNGRTIPLYALRRSREFQRRYPAGALSRQIFRRRLPRVKLSPPSRANGAGSGKAVVRADPLLRRRLKLEPAQLASQGSTDCSN